MVKNELITRAAMLALLVMSVTGCSSPSHVIAPPPEPPRIPALPPQARQPAMPSECWPTCSKSLTDWRVSTRKRLTWPTPQEPPVKTPPTP